MNPVNWFEIPVNNFERGKDFYQNVFDVQLQDMEMGPSMMGMFPWETKAEGSAGCIIKSEGYVPSTEGSVVYFSVADIEGTLGKIGANGGSTVFPKMAIGEHGFVAQFMDTEGNRVALHSTN
jgi:predicted enzyme related to lactoylglutathione lyase